MRVSDANDRFVIPIDHVIQQTHRAGMRDKGTDFRFVDGRVHFVNSAEIRQTLRTHNQRARCPLASQVRAGLALDGHVIVG